MKEVVLAGGNQIAIVDDVDFEWVNMFRWNSNQCHRNRYARGWVNGRCQYMHRIILERKIGRKLNKREFTDHINGNTFDNRRENLRVCDQTHNNMNAKDKKNKTGYRGVWENPKSKPHPYMACIAMYGKVHYLGVFETAELAHEAYEKAAIEMFGEYNRSH